MPEQEAEIIRRVLRGQTEAYAVLIERHRDRAMTLALRMLKNREDAEEALQDAFVKAFRGLRSFKADSKFATWLYRILYNGCATRLRRSGSYGKEIPDYDLVEKEAVRTEARPDRRYEFKELQEIVAQGMEEIPAIYGGILTLYFVQEMSYEEIAEVTGISLNTVKTRLFRARKYLRDYIARSFSETKSGGTRQTMRTLTEEFL